jgi:hypothetical protein
MRAQARGSIEILVRLVACASEKYPKTISQKSAHTCRTAPSHVISKLLLALGFLFHRPTAVGAVVQGGAGDSAVICDSTM